MNKRKTAMFVFLFAALLSLFGAGTSKKVYIAGNGKKYHYKTCKTIQRSKKITELTIKVAKEKGYKPCKVCNPGE
ncbi:hypothetical protein [Treponema pedis]|uniref:Nuclease n=1 Tax=Treponema pedis TaxID=409322 RepID=A0A7S6WNR9_9SPIR|nr:hypothetical protein [Treponema pedis]QOW60548.1 hypothetical protein IFE08_12195 [Treponema pedis]